MNDLVEKAIRGVEQNGRSQFVVLSGADARDITFVTVHLDREKRTVVVDYFGLPLKLAREVAATLEEHADGIEAAGKVGT